MERPETKNFMKIYRAALEGRKIDTETDQSGWERLFEMASVQNVLPMIYDSTAEAFNRSDCEVDMKATIRAQVMGQITTQIRRTDAFLKLYRKFAAAGGEPIVLKGLICRQLYPDPDARSSGDEDLLVEEDVFSLYDGVLTTAGWSIADEKTDPLTDFEVSYRSERSPLCLEVHKTLFAPENAAYGDMNRLFEGARERSVRTKIDGVEIRTLCETDHVLYLILHAFKHFLHGGVGIRQISDIARFADVYRTKIDWIEIREKCKKVRADRFAEALLQIAVTHMGLDPAALSPDWQPQINSTDLLEDCLNAGVYGTSSMARRHSGNMTLHAAAEGSAAGGAKRSLLRTVFPSARELSGRYRYLKKLPILLPVAWCDRILRYRGEKGEVAQNAKEAIRIGNERIELLEEYGIIDS